MMISSLIDIFCTQAREHKSIKSFFYNRSYELGTGREAHPLLWLEDPIYGRNEGNSQQLQPKERNRTQDTNCST